MAAQEPLAYAASVRDSADVLALAREAQHRFERFRRRNLPSTWGSWGGYCDERVGRMCMRYDEGDWAMEPEPVVIGRERDVLLQRLKETARVVPADPWVLGQRIRYLSEASRWDEALVAADGCRVSEAGWCDALRGFALHGAGQYVDAEGAFEKALNAMEPSEAARWRDPSVLLQDRGDVLRTGDESADPLDLLKRTWQLADPLLLVDGNDRLTEHYARFVMSGFRRQAETTYGMAWGPDLEELLVRYGWEVGWERTRPGPGESQRAGIVGHHHPESLTYMPPPAFISIPATADPARWDMDPPQPRSGYAPLYAPIISRADVQVARFWRGDSVRVVAAYRMVPPPQNRHAPPGPDAWMEPLPPETPVDAGLFMISDRDGQVYGRRSSAGPTGSLTVTAPAGSYVVSIEAWSRGRAVASRARHGLRADSFPPDVAVLSDALLVDPEAGLPSTLDEAARHAWPGTSIPPGRPLALAWEVSGLGRWAEPVGYRITLERLDRSFAQKAGTLFGLLGGGPDLTIAWSEELAVGDRRHFRAADLGLPELDDGRYRLRLEITLPGRSTMATEREVTVAR